LWPSLEKVLEVLFHNPPPLPLKRHMFPSLSLTKHQQKSYL
jgi:hypothetical protein